MPDKLDLADEPPDLLPIKELKTDEAGPEDLLATLDNFEEPL